MSNTCGLPVVCMEYARSPSHVLTSKVVSNGSDCGINEGDGLSMKRLYDHKMVELEGVTTVVKDGTQARNVSK